MDNIKIYLKLFITIVFILLLTTGCSHLHSNIYKNEMFNLKKGTLDWQKTFKNTSILEIPIIKPNNSAIYLSSTDNPHGVKDMTVEYDSKSQIDRLIPIVLSRLKKKGFKINIGTVHCREWAWRNNTDDNTIEYHGTSPKDECVYLEFTENKNLVKVNVGIAD
ncbi:hypothetical protein [Dokdonia sp.]|uniref:hypothetical protein n=1 Tax=Dokdonia sp. TaxID=2024995 RepID=UPI003265C63C